MLAAAPTAVAGPPALFDAPGVMHRSAVLDPTGRFRYRLDRWWDDRPRLAFLMLNPSTADAEADDNTIRRCIGFARREGAGGITVVNVGAYRAADPDVWAAAADPYGPDNHLHICQVTSQAARVVVAYGAHPRAAARAAGLLAELSCTATLWCLGVTKDGHPRHPLYVPAGQPLVRFDIPQVVRHAG